MLRLALALAFFAPALAAAQPAPRFSEVRVRLGEPADLARLAALGVGLDEHADLARDGGGLALTTVVNEHERAALAAGPFPFDVLVDDMAAAFAARPQPTPAERAALEAERPLRGFEYGSMAGFYTIDEMVAQFDSMAARYPALVAPRVSIGTTGQGRALWMVKISDDVATDEAEPEVFYTALHHAREPQSMMTVLYFMYYLLENYGADPEVTALVDSREFYFVPMVNPDGYAYNQTTSPAGGGMWRKNRRANANGTFGVDINRNYGYLWGLDNVGSSPSPSAESYRGTAAWSEPETRALRDFVNGRHIATAVNFHSRGQLYLFPWGYADNAFTPDDALFRSVSADMAAENGYAFGTGPEVLYPTNGEADDWLYGDTALRPKILAWTAEVCNRTDEGFWPPLDRIVPVAQENVRANLALARLAGVATAAEPGAGAPGAGALSVSPNPAVGAVRLHFEAAAGPATVEVTDVLGRRALRATLPAAPAGRRTHTVDVGALAPGRYLVVVTDAAGGRLVRPLTRAR